MWGRTNLSVSTIEKSLLVTREIMNLGEFSNVTPTYLTNQVDGTDGFTIVGRPSVNAGSSLYYSRKWNYKIDLTNYNTIKYCVKKNANHGSSIVIVTNGIGSTSFITYAKKEIMYGNMPTAYKEYSLDISTITDIKTVSFIGGYVDISGSTASSTSYCNIRFES